MKYTVTWPTPINVEGIQRQPGEVFEQATPSSDMKALLKNGYVKKGEVVK